MPKITNYSNNSSKYNILSKPLLTTGRAKDIKNWAKIEFINLEMPKVQGKLFRKRKSAIVSSKDQGISNEIQDLECKVIESSRSSLSPSQSEYIKKSKIDEDADSMDTNVTKSSRFSY